MTRTTTELAPPSPNFRATPTGGRLATTYDLACNRPHTRRIFSGIGFRTCDPPVPTEYPVPSGREGIGYRLYQVQKYQVKVSGRNKYQYQPVPDTEKTGINPTLVDARPTTPTSPSTASATADSTPTAAA
ncbi:hypothetical protein AVEN_7508-1 [Araneus ventricosus]|uniref:Uncharacterized protein n=1 Tax=Araneus ventricosus TaxID=182803 RepID=A0A4Y2QNN1_ARAVE|nr:hypothetical protein AVEN_7508-1 [Araneus ventricosus]